MFQVDGLGLEFEFRFGLGARLTLERFERLLDGVTRDELRVLLLELREFCLDPGVLPAFGERLDFREAFVGFLRLALLGVPQVGAEEQAKQPGDPGGREDGVAPAESSAGELADPAGFPDDAFRQAVAQWRRFFDPGIEARDEEGG